MNIKRMGNTLVFFSLFIVSSLFSMEIKNIADVAIRNLSNDGVDILFDRHKALTHDVVMPRGSSIGLFHPMIKDGDVGIAIITRAGYFDISIKNSQVLVIMRGEPSIEKQSMPYKPEIIATVSKSGFVSVSPYKGASDVKSKGKMSEGN